MLKLKKCLYGYIVPVEICDQVLFFLLDTGAQRTMIQASVAEKLHLSMKSADFRINNSSNYQTKLDRVCCAELLVDSVSAGMIEMVVYDYYQFPLRGIHGILGTDVIYKFCFTLSFANRMFSISKNNATAGKEVFTVGIENNIFNAIIDTAASKSWIAQDSDLAKKLNFRKRFLLSLSFSSISVERNRECKLFYIMIGGYSTSCKKIHVGRSVMRNDCKIDMILGLDVIHRFHVGYSDGNFALHPCCDD